jgi:flagellin
MSTINSNITSLVIQSSLTNNQRELTTFSKQLSTGLRVVTASDDAAILSISNKLTSQVRGLGVAVRNANDAISMLQTADAAASGLSEVLVRMKELAVQAANDTNGTSDREALKVEFEDLQAHLSSKLETSTWNNQVLLKTSDGSPRALTFHVGPAEHDYMTINMTSLDQGALNNAFSTASLDSRGDSHAALGMIDLALTQVDQERVVWGAAINRLTHAADHAANMTVFHQTGRSTLVDADYALATAEMARAMIVEQAGAAMLSMSNQQPYYVLALLR